MSESYSGQGQNSDSAYVLSFAAFSLPRRPKGSQTKGILLGGGSEEGSFMGASLDWPEIYSSVS